MPSNAELIAAIGALATELQIDTPTEGLNNDQLSKALAGLRAKKAEAEAAAKAEARPPYSVAPGRSITSQIGILDAGDEVKSEHVGGADNLQALVNLGFVVKA